MTPPRLYYYHYYYYHCCYHDWHVMTATTTTTMSSSFDGYLNDGWQVGIDQYGRMITDELNRDGVGTSRVVVKEGLTSPFTYVVVDMETLTRTCIHTPCEEGEEEEEEEEEIGWEK